MILIYGQNNRQSFLIMSNSMTGLTRQEAQQRLQTYGPNKLPEPRQPGLALIFLCQFKSPFIYVLLVAAIVKKPFFKKHIHNYCFIDLYQFFYHMTGIKSDQMLNKFNPTNGRKDDYLRRP